MINYVNVLIARISLTCTLTMLLTPEVWWCFFYFFGQVSGHLENTKHLWENWWNCPENRFPLTNRILQKAHLMPSSIFKCLLAEIIALSYIEELHTELQTFFKEKYLKGSTFHLRFQTGCSFLNPAGLSKEKSGLPTFITRILSRRKDSQRSLINARNTQRATFVLISVEHLINNARFSKFYYYYTIYAVHFPLLPFGNPSFASLKQSRQSY